MSRAAFAVGTLVAGLLLAACSQTEDPSWFYKEPFPANRADLYRQYGPPDTIRVEGDNRWLRTTMPKPKA